MIRPYCDGCGKLISKNYVDTRFRPVRIFEYTDAIDGRLRRACIKAEVIVAVDEKWNTGHVCFECLMKLLCEKNETSKFDTNHPLFTPAELESTNSFQENDKDTEDA